MKRLFAQSSIGALLVAVQVNSVAAQEAAPLPQGSAPSSEGSSSAADDGLGDIVVTAQKRSESVQRTPIAITAVTGDAITERGVSNLLDLQTLAPGVNIQQRTSFGVVTIRGVGFDIITAGADSSVAVHLDGVYVARPSAALAGLYDLERVEITRGPQGTLYGRNATGGAVNIISRRPTNEISGYVDASYGNYNAWTLEAALGGPIISDVLKVRLAGKIERRDGYGKNLVTGQDVDNLRTEAARFSLEFTPASDFSALLVADYFHERDAGFPFHYGGQPVAGTVPYGVAYGGYVAPDIRDVAHDVQPVNRRKFYGAGLTLEWKPADFTLRSITGVRRTDSYYLSDLDNTSFNIIGGITREEGATQFSQEFQALYDRSGLHAIIGAYYFWENDFAGALGTFNPNLIPRPAGVNSPVGVLPLGALDQRGRLKTSAKAIFGQVTYDLLPNASITLGGRYSSETKSINERSLFVPVQNATQAASTTFSSFTPKFGLEYRPTDNIMLYASASRGFKSGSYAVGAVTPAFAPETIWSYELGAKTTFFDRRLRANIALFHYDYSDLQQGLVATTSTVITNAASARIDGAELEVELAPVRGLTLSANLSLLDAKFSNYLTKDPARIALGTLDLKGNRLSQSPKATVNLTAQYAIEAGRWTITPRVEYFHSSKVFFTPFNLDTVSEGSYGLLNGFLTIATADDHWSISLFGRNLSNKVVKAGGWVGAGVVGTPINASLLPPRTYGIRANYSF